MSLYDTLNVKRDASPADIKLAYRRAAKKHHSDRNGGDDKKMSEINIAYAVLSDPEKRRQYDETGEFNQAPEESVAEMAIRLLHSVVAHTAEEAASNANLPIVSAVNTKLLHAKSELTKQLDNVNRAIKNLTKKRKSYKFKNDALIGHMIDDKLNVSKRTVAQLTKHIDALTLAESIFADHGYEDVLTVPRDELNLTEEHILKLYEVWMGPPTRKHV